MSIDEKYMARCIQLARCGRQYAAPNPMVGAVIVCDGRIIGEGYHIRCGEAHAEVNAIRSVREEDKPLLCQSTMYVSLEPCSHYGRTPPCADLIISCQIPHVVVGCVDPFSEVAGRGIEKLRQAGVDVQVGVLEQECLELNRRFITSHLQHRPYIILKWAQSADGFIDCLRTSPDEPPTCFSNSLNSMFVHRQRSDVQAILVGTRTALLDNPSLTVRHWTGSSPLRLVIDRTLSLPLSLRLFDGSVPTLVFTEHRDYPCKEKVEYITLDFSHDILPQLLGVLYERHIQSLLVEGGTTLLQSFIDASLWDEIHVETAPIVLEKGIKAPILPTQLIPESRVFSGHKRDLYRKEGKSSPTVLFI